MKPRTIILPNGVRVLLGAITAYQLDSFTVTVWTGEMRHEHSFASFELAKFFLKFLDAQFDHVNPKP